MSMFNDWKYPGEPLDGYFEQVLGKAAEKEKPKVDMYNVTWKREAPLVITSTQTPLERLLIRLEQLDPEAAAYVRSRNPPYCAGDLLAAFVWHGTPQGHEYWYDLHRKERALP